MVISSGPQSTSDFHKKIADREGRPTTFNMHIRENFLNRLKVMASSKQMACSAMVKVWLLERLEAEENGKGIDDRTEPKT